MKENTNENTNENPKKVLDPNELSLLKKVQMIEGDVKSMIGDKSKENKTNENVRRSSRSRKKIRYYEVASDENDEINNGMEVISKR